MPSESVHTCVTSPPYYGTRDYGTGTWTGGQEGCEHNVQRWEGPKQTQGAQSGHAAQADRLDRQTCACGAVRIDQQLGLEASPDAYVASMVEVCHEIRRVLRSDGTFWLVLGDSYCSTNKWAGIKPKDLIGIPWRVALGLQADGWYLRSDIIWEKRNCLPQSVQDRPTMSHEYVFLLTRSARYYFDLVAIMEPAVGTNHHDLTGMGYSAPGQKPQSGNRPAVLPAAPVRRRRTVWSIPTQPYRGGRPLRRLPRKVGRALHFGRQPRGGHHPRPLLWLRHHPGGGSAAGAEGGGD